jgi:hypothetical protein
MSPGRGESETRTLLKQLLSRINAWNVSPFGTLSLVPCSLPVRYFRRFPIVPAILAQLVAAFLVIQVADPVLPAWCWWLVHGVLAAVLGALAGLPRWWIPMQVLAVPLLGVLVVIGLPMWCAPLGLVVLLLLYGGGVATRVPLYLSATAAHVALEHILAGRSAPQAVDLGAGFGGPMRHLAQKFPAGSFRSVEASPATWMVAWVLGCFRRNLRVQWGDLWRTDLSQCDLIYVFLSPEPMPRLWQHVLAQAKPGALLVSNTFPVPDQVADQVIDLSGRADARLFVYTVPARSAAATQERA